MHSFNIKKLCILKNIKVFNYMLLTILFLSFIFIHFQIWIHPCTTLIDRVEDVNTFKYCETPLNIKGLKCN